MKVMKGVVYEVQKAGVTLEWDPSYQKAEAAFKSASPGYVTLYRIDLARSKKFVLAVR